MDTWCRHGLQHTLCMRPGQLTWWPPVTGSPCVSDLVSLRVDLPWPGRRVTLCMRPAQLTWRPPVTRSPGHPPYPPLVTRSTGRSARMFPQQLGRYLIVCNDSPRNNLGHYSSRQLRPALSYIIQNLPLNSTLSLLSPNKRRIFRTFIQLPNTCTHYSPCLLNKCNHRSRSFKCSVVYTVETHF